MSDLCTDNRFELIEKYKQKLIESTNIKTSQKEMMVLDDILFRCWQMGWLDILEKNERNEKTFDYWIGNYSPYRCPRCGHYSDNQTLFCAHCGNMFYVIH